jgi:hypothetical protein
LELAVPVTVMGEADPVALAPTVTARLDETVNNNHAVSMNAVFTKQSFWNLLKRRCAGSAKAHRYLGQPDQQMKRR